jgi:hypothetical protein
MELAMSQKGTQTMQDRYVKIAAKSLTDEQLERSIESLQQKIENSANLQNQSTHNNSVKDGNNVARNNLYTY